MTINMLKIPMYTLILFGSSVEHKIAYGIDKIDPQLNPIQTKLTISINGSVMNYILMNPFAPAKKLTM